MKARAASGHRSPKKHGTLDLAHPADADVLLHHCRALGLLPDLPSPSGAAAAGDSPQWGPAAHLLPDDLIRIQDPTLAYTCFRTTGLPPDAPSLPQMGLCQFDSRLASTWDFTWADLQVIGSSPNYCAHFPSGFTPVILSAPDWEVERIRWGIHSLCQHTIEAVLTLTQGPSPPMWTRRRRPDGQSSFVPTHPAGRTHLGPPRRPPRADGFDSHAPHSGLPEGTGWCPDASWSTPPSDTMQREYGPFSLAFQGLDLGSKADLTVASLNTNGLTTAKLTELLWLRAAEQIDVFILVDTRCSGRQLKFLGRQARETMGIGSWTLGSPARSLTANGRSTRHELVGGQLILINPKWGRMVRSSRMDPTGLGILTEVTLGASGGDILILGTYFPCPSGSCSGHSNKLWDKVQAWLGSQGRSQSPQSYLQAQLQDRVLRHLGRGATSGAARRNIALIGGDFNSSWSGHTGPLRGLGGWAAASSLLSPVASLAATHPICSYFQGGTPKSLIDHILLSQPSQGDITRAGVLTGSFFGSISDHRPVLLGLRLWEGAGVVFPSLNALQRPPVRSFDLDLTNKTLVREYQAYTPSHLPDKPTDPLAASKALQQLSLQSAAWLSSKPVKTGHRTHRRRRFDGWSPGAMALKANLAVVIDIQAHLRGYGGHLPWRVQADINRHLPPILRAWERTVAALTWTDPAAPHRFLDCTGIVFNVASVLRKRLPYINCNAKIENNKKFN